MNKEIKAKWVAALRSGDYKQTKGQLRNVNNQFCCLGVLCNLHAQAHPEIAAKQTDANWYMDEEAILPDEVMAWSEVNTRNGLFAGGTGLNGLGTLASLNDAGTSFADIAKIIEKHF